jgi:hypothetical protein
MRLFLGLCAAAALELDLADAQPMTPHGLLANFQASPALGVTAAPQFSWIVPAAPGESDHTQTSYRIVVADAANAKNLVWDSGFVKGTASLAVPYSGKALLPGHAYNWTVATTTSSSRGGDDRTSEPSDPATFITALYSGFGEGAAYIWTDAEAGGTFAFARKVVPKPASKIVRATAFITAVADDYMLCAYRLYMGGVLVNVGPGRGEAPIWGGNGTYMEKPYQTLDVTRFLPDGGDLVLAIQGLGATGGKGTGTCAPVYLKNLVGHVRHRVFKLRAFTFRWTTRMCRPVRRARPEARPWYPHAVEARARGTSLIENTLNFNRDSSAEVSHPF